MPVAKAKLATQQPKAAKAPNKAEVPHVRGFSIASRAQTPATDTPASTPKQGLHSPIFADEEVCKQFGIHENAKPSCQAVDDMVMYGELAQVRQKANGHSSGCQAHG